MLALGVLGCRIMSPNCFGDVDWIPVRGVVLENPSCESAPIGLGTTPAQLPVVGARIRATAVRLNTDLTADAACECLSGASNWWMGQAVTDANGQFKAHTAIPNQCGPQQLLVCIDHEHFESHSFYCQPSELITDSRIHHIYLRRRRPTNP